MKLLLMTIALTTLAAAAAEPPRAVGPVPTARQIAWHQLGVYAFVHFSINTFTEKEWGNGDESPAKFDPTDFDADQIVTTLKNAGLTGVVLTCKHHDGFCLWPSKYTEHSVKHSPWKNGHGDVVREISDACHRHGMKFGVYLSPWDRNSADYGKPAYIAYYRNQLRELLTDYGPVFEVWFDGANGGSGYYGGANEVRKIDNRTYYDWPGTIKIVRELQPDACIFSDAGPDVRWIGNENGVAGEPCWQTISPAGMAPGHADATLLNHGDRRGDTWLPAEADVSIRPGWFYHPAEDHRIKTVDELTDIYFKSIGRGTNLILNVPPDRRGRIADPDVAVLTAWKKRLDEMFANDLTAGAAVSADSVRGNDCSADKITRAAGTGFFCSEDAVTTPTMELTWKQPVTFNLIRIGEQIALGQRVDRIEFQTWDGAAWRAFAGTEGIGPQRLVRGPRVTTTRLRIKVLQAAACPALCKLGVFDSGMIRPAGVPAPAGQVPR